MIEAAYSQGLLPVYTEDEAGPYQTIPYPGSHWHPAGHPVRYAHEYVREGTAKQLTLFHPASGEVRVKGVRSCPNAVLHPWLHAELTAILATLPEPEVLPPGENRRRWERWQEGLSIRITLPQDLPPLRMLLVWDNLTGHHTPDFILWLFAHGIMPLFTPLGGSYLNMAESIQRILKRRALDGQHPSRGTIARRLHHTGSSATACTCTGPRWTMIYSAPFPTAESWLVSGRGMRRSTSRRRSDGVSW